MKSIEDRLKQVDPSDINIASHRAQLKARLASEPPRRSRAPYKQALIVVALVAVLTISGISAIRPDWTENFFSVKQIYEKVIHNKDGSNMVMRAFECNVNNCMIPDSGATIVHVADNGDTIRCKVVAMGTDPSKEHDIANLLAANGINMNSVENTTSATVEVTTNGTTKQGTMLILKQGCGFGTTAEEIMKPTADHLITDVDHQIQGLPSDFALEQNYPNPFNPETTIRYSLNKDSDISLKVYSIEGKEVATLASGYQTAGSYSVHFNGHDLSSGTYLYRLTTAASTETKQMMLVK